MNTPEALSRALATIFMAEDRDLDQFVERGGHLLDKKWRWLRPLGRRMVEAFSDATTPRLVSISKFIRCDHGFIRACALYSDDLRIVNLSITPTEMRPVAAAKSWNVPSIRTAGELAQWLGVSTRDLDWFSDLRMFEQKLNRNRSRHYHYRVLAKRFGQARMIESPKERLKELQRHLLTGILDQIPLHESAHGFRRSRSILTFAAPHVGKQVVLKIDLQDFFPSIAAAQIQAIFRTVGYREEVADLLAGLCTNATPADAWRHEIDQPALRRSVERLYSKPHLPQGAPTSPALANLCAYRLDCRLAGLARSAGATYTRYADDLAFSGDRDFDRVVKRFGHHVCSIVMEEGFSVHHRKTRIMRQGVCQRLAGVVVNERLNCPRKEFDRLKATINNCIHQGPASQNRNGHEDFRAHLLGKISFVEMVHAARGARLRTLFQQIEW